MDKCVTCRYNTNDYICHPNCSGCDGSSHYEGRKRDMTGFNEVAKEIHKNAEDVMRWWLEDPNAEGQMTMEELIAEGSGEA